MSAPPKRPFRPTKQCPHRLCKPLHGILLLEALIVWVHDILADWRMWLLLLMMIPLVVLVTWLVHGKSPVQVAIEDAAHTGTGGLRLVVTRPVWLRVAVGLDLLVMALGAVAVGAAIGRDEPPSIPTTPAESGLFVTALVGFSALHLYAHRKATDPVKPKRARVPAWLSRLAPAPGKG